jgi:hypothetical protein
MRPFMTHPAISLRAGAYKRSGVNGIVCVENVCAESTHDCYANGFTKIPEADKPDF